MSAQVPEKIQAFTADESGKGSVKDVSLGPLRDGEVYIKVEYAAQNPTDWKHLAMFSPKGAIIGGDVAGTVVALGENLHQDFKIGDKVAGIVHGNLYAEQGAFATYTRVQSDMVFKVPKGMAMDEASTFGVAYVTALQALIHSQKHGWPPAKVEGEPWYLIYGGSTSVGLFAIQVAKVLGYRVITTASSRNHDLVKSFGADIAIDYSDPAKAIEEIKKATNGGVSIGLDTIAEGNSYETCVKCFGEKGGRLNATLWPDENQKAVRKDVEIVTTLMYTLFGKPFTTFGKDWEVIPEDHKFGQEIGSKSTDFISTYNIRGNPIELRGGLDSVQEGLDHQKAGEVSGKKLVYQIAE